MTYHVSVSLYPVVYHHYDYHNCHDGCCALWCHDFGKFGKFTVMALNIIAADMTIIIILACNNYITGNPGNSFHFMLITWLCHSQVKFYTGVFFLIIVSANEG